MCITSFQLHGFVSALCGDTWSLGFTQLVENLTVSESSKEELDDDGTLLITQETASRYHPQTVAFLYLKQQMLLQ